MKLSIWGAVVCTLGAVLPPAVAADLTPLPTPLSIGSPAPKLDVQSFLKGEPVTDLTNGTVYVIEFSGTECVPCVNCIPHLTELQKKHKDVVLISVYGDDEKVLAAFLERKGNEIGYRVAIDRNEAMWNTWSKPACQVGVPQAFIVDQTGRIAWIGNPAHLAAPLAQVVAGTFDPRADVMRLRVEQGAVLRQRRQQEREDRGKEEYRRINKLVTEGKLADALAATEAAPVAYEDCPNATELLRGMKMYLLANLPGKREDAIALAIDLAIEAKLSGRSIRICNTAGSLLNAAERAPPKDRDQRLIDVAMVLLRDSDPLDLRGKPDQAIRSHRAWTLQLLGRAYHLRGDNARAVASIQDAIAIVAAQKPAPGEDEKEFAETMEEWLADLNRILTESKQSADPPVKGK
jgi:thiol-disulfide isomerase/thioredoxin